MRLFAAAISSALFVTPVIANPIDMTGMSCVRTLEYGTQTWEFYGDVAIQYFQDGSVKRLPRIGEGAYEKFDRDGEWLAAYYIYDDGDGIKSEISLTTRVNNSRRKPDRSLGDRDIYLLSWLQKVMGRVKRHSRAENAGKVAYSMTA